MPTKSSFAAIASISPVYGDSERLSHRRVAESINGIKAEAGRGSQLMHSSRNARARASPSMAWRTSPPSRTSMIGIRTRPGVAGAVMSLPTQDGLGAFHDIARRIRCRRDQLLHRFAWGRLEFLARLLDLGQEVGIFQHRIESRPQGLYPVRRNSGRR